MEFSITEQYLSIKEKHPGVVLSFITEDDDFYIFDKDTLTEMVSKRKENVNLDDVVKGITYTFTVSKKDVFLFVDEIDNVLDMFLSGKWKTSDNEEIQEYRKRLASQKEEKFN